MSSNKKENGLSVDRACINYACSLCPADKCKNPEQLSRYEENFGYKRSKY